MANIYFDYRLAIAAMEKHVSADKILIESGKHRFFGKSQSGCRCGKSAQFSDPVSGVTVALWKKDLAEKYHGVTAEGLGEQRA
ncbi:MAG: hypothetical protein V8R80_06460 [Eubacterium sp.]